jgi:hypothetical protein
LLLLLRTDVEHKGSLLMWSALAATKSSTPQEMPSHPSW